MPTMGAYSASKFALEGITEALYYEMRPWNVTVSLIQPGLDIALELAFKRFLLLLLLAAFKKVYASE